MDEGGLVIESNKQVPQLRTRFVAILCVIAVWFGIVFLLETGDLKGDPVEYPNGWPLEYVYAPAGSVKTEFSFNDLIGIPHQARMVVFPWYEVEYGGVANRVRSWEIGFDCKGGFAAARAALESELRTRGYLHPELMPEGGYVYERRMMVPGYLDYISPDYRLRVILSRPVEPLLGDRLLSIKRRPITLSIVEYEDPIDYLEFFAEGRSFEVVDLN